MASELTDGMGYDYRDPKVRMRTVADDIFDAKVRLYVLLNSQTLQALSELEQETYIALGQDPEIREWVRRALDKAQQEQAGYFPSRYHRPDMTLPF